MRIKELRSTEELQAYVESLKLVSTSTTTRDAEPLDPTQPTSGAEKDRDYEHARLLG